MAFADAPVRDVEYRDLYGLSAIDALPATGDIWKTTVHAFAPLYLKARGYNVPLFAKWSVDPATPFAQSAQRFMGTQGMTVEMFEQHVGKVLIGTLIVTTVAVVAIRRRRRERHLRVVSRQVAMADLSAWRNRRRRRR